MHYSFLQPDQSVTAESYTCDLYQMYEKLQQIWQAVVNRKFGSRGKALEDVNMRESSDEDEEVQHVNPVNQSENCGRREGHQGKSRELRGWQKWQCGPGASASGANLLSPLERGHLLFKCSDGCLEGATLKDVRGCSFPGAVAREPITTLWDAWLATSIFRRSDISVGEKIRMHKEGAVCYDADSLKEVLKMAYQKCINWTDFIANTKKIVKHAPVEGYYFESSYNEALRMIRNDLEEESVRRRPQKSGPVGFVASEGALALESDGQRGDILVKMATTFDRVLEVLEEWSTFRSWVIVWPIDPRMNEERSKKLLKLAKTHLESGGEIVTVWPLVNEKKEAKWRESPNYGTR
ncbi:hypothetical protein Y032_0088g2197 [Ancylostoma ceylanicum]|nr:hypothetical protein Y032_0088g2197 [Ancylostoma ceylanicum]